MADYTITAAQEGVYEIALTAATPATVEILTPDNGPNQLFYNSVIISVHSGAEPVYFSVTDPTPAPQDQEAGMVVSNMWREIPLKPFAATTTLALVSASPAVVSVSRS